MPICSGRGRHAARAPAAAAAASSFVLLCLGTYPLAATAQSLVGTGGITPYSGGGGGGGRRGRLVRAPQEPPAGFFLAGSSIPGVNGVYGPRVGNDRLAGNLTYLKGFVVHGAYPSDHSGWVLAHVQQRFWDAGWLGRRNEWVLIDATGRDRFGQDGERSFIPGAGSDFWYHLHRAARPGAPPTSSAEAASEHSTSLRVHEGDEASEDEAELPWQLVAFGDVQRLDEVWEQHKQHRERAAADAGVRPDEHPKESDARHEAAAAAAAEAVARGKHEEACQVYALAARHLGWPPVESDLWGACRRINLASSPPVHTVVTQSSSRAAHRLLSNLRTRSYQHVVPFCDSRRTALSSACGMRATST